MKRTLLGIAAIVLCACSTKNTPAIIGFDYDRIAPLMFKFTNTSVGFDSYKWDFGDGTWAYGEDALHSYETTGTYTVTLTGTTADGSKYDVRETLDVTAPDIYIAGYTLYAIPYENRYYKLIFKDDALLPSSWDWYTIYSPLLDDTDLPYTYDFQNPVMIQQPNNHDYWTVQVVRNTTTSSSTDDVSCMKGRITHKELMEYRPEYLLQTETGSTTVGIRMGYAY